MIDEKRKRIYTDFSTLARFTDCKEQQRMGGLLGFRPQATDPKLAFGKAIHAGWAAFYDALAGGFRDEIGWHFDGSLALKDNAINHAKAEFVKALAKENSNIGIMAEPGERRSLERGLALLEAYAWKWRNEPYENILNAEGEPLVEVSFRYYLTTFEGYDVFIVGTIDRIMLHTLTGRPRNFEGKTTTEALPNFILRRKPNHQITTYYRGGNEIVSRLGLPEIKDTVWDCMYLSDRAPDMAHAARGHKHRFWKFGIDVGCCDRKSRTGSISLPDFLRVTTMRTETDFSEFLFDAEQQALEYCKWLTSGAVRWPRSAPRACHNYGGCYFRERCSLNLDPDQERRFLEERFKVEVWEPWRKIVEAIPTMRQDDRRR